MALVRNKTFFCLALITLFTACLFARSVVVREQWIVPTFLGLKISPNRGVAGVQLAVVNNWLKEGIFKLRFSAYRYPDSVETATLNKRGFYASYLPGVQYPLFIIFKILDATGIVPDIYEKRGTQLLILILWNYLLHFLLAITLCLAVFLVCRKIGFDHLNSTLLAIVPAIVQFNNANSLYWHHLSYFHDIPVLFPFALYVLLELLRSHTSPLVKKTVRLMQPPLAFIGILISWFFIFAILTVYVLRISRKEIQSPIPFASLGLSNLLLWVKQSFLFFIPLLLAMALWTYQMVYYAQHVAQTGLSNVPVSGFRTDLWTNLLFRMGITDGFSQFLYYLVKLFFVNVHTGYGFFGVAMLYAVVYMVTHGRKFTTSSSSLVAKAFCMLFIPCILHYLFFVQNCALHLHTSILLSPALSVSFVFAPIFILQMMKKHHLIPAVVIKKKTIAVATLLALSSSSLYAVSQIYGKRSVTKFFSPPAIWHADIGDFLKKNTAYHDVIFSSDYHTGKTAAHELHVSHFHDKLIHYADNLDRIYRKTKMITADHIVNILYFDHNIRNIQHLDAFLTRNNIQTEYVEKEKLCGLLTFDGKQFRSWYERVHECDVYPQRCAET